MHKIKHIAFDNLKNLRGWRTKRKLVAFAVDDYCNVRVASREARENLVQAGLDLSVRFDKHDAVETRQDLEALFEVLDSVRDGSGRPPVFTAYAVSANPDFERIRNDDRNIYHYEGVRETFARLATEQPHAYAGVWALWQEGILNRLIRPQFHGREHINVNLFEHKLRTGSEDLRINLENDSLAALADEPAMPGVGFTHAFGLHDSSELPRHRDILSDGLDLFEKTWGFRSTTFAPPAMKLHPSLDEVALAGGVLALDKPLRCTRTMGDGTSRREINHSGRQGGQNHLTIVRNVVFEPCADMGFEPITRAMQQIIAAFRWSKPAIISSHRVNFCGHLDKVNRKQGLSALKNLLDCIVERWPDVEFVGVDELAEQFGGGK